MYSKRLFQLVDRTEDKRFDHCTHKLRKEGRGYVVGSRSSPGGNPQSRATQSTLHCHRSQWPNDGPCSKLQKFEITFSASS